MDYRIYQEAHNLELAHQFMSLLGNRFTHAMRRDTFTIDTTSVAIPLQDTVHEVSRDEHQQALVWVPDESLYENMSQRLINHLAGAGWD